MRKFLLLVGKLLLVLMIINVGLYLWIGNAENSRFYNYYSSLKKLNQTHYRYLITGDSHANDCWYTENDSSVLDFTFPGDNQIDIQRKISFLKKNDITYDIHLYEMDGQVLSTYRESTNNNDLSLLMDNHEIWIKIRIMMPLFFNPRMWTDMINQVFPTEEATSIPLTTIDTSGMELRAKTQFLNERFSSKMFNAMKENIETTLEQKSDIVLLHYPFYESYLNIIENHETFAQSIDSSTQLAKKLNLNILDYRRLICKPVNFVNQDHLSFEGAKICRQYLKNCMKIKNCQPETCIDIK